MNEMSKPIVGVILGDHAGIGPEVTIKAMRENIDKCTFVLISNKNVFVSYAEKLAPEFLPMMCGASYETPDFSEVDKLYVVDVPSDGEIVPGQISAASGKVMIDAMVMACDLRKRGKIDGIYLGPLTKASLHEADSTFAEEAKLFDREFGVPGCSPFVKCGGILRATVTGHCSFREIPDLLTPESIYATGLSLFDLTRIFGRDHLGLAVAALNPHAGENGLFGDEESRVIEPAIEMLRETLGVKVIGPCPADTVLQKGIHGEVGGILYLYHDQGNLAIKSYKFDEGVVCFVNLPCPLVSPGHGSALDIAGKNIADPKNSKLAMEDLLTMIAFDKANKNVWKYSEPEKN